MWKTEVLYWLCTSQQFMSCHYCHLDNLYISRCTGVDLKFYFEDIIPDSCFKFFKKKFNNIPDWTKNTPEFQSSRQRLETEPKVSENCKKFCFVEIFKFSRQGVSCQVNCSLLCYILSPSISSAWIPINFKLQTFSDESQSQTINSTVGLSLSLW